MDRRMCAGNRDGMRRYHPDHLPDRQHDRFRERFGLPRGQILPVFEQDNPHHRRRYHNLWKAEGKLLRRRGICRDAGNLQDTQVPARPHVPRQCDILCERGLHHRRSESGPGGSQPSDGEDEGPDIHEVHGHGHSHGIPASGAVHPVRQSRAFQYPRGHRRHPGVHPAIHRPALRAVFEGIDQEQADGTHQRVRRCIRR